VSILRSHDPEMWRARRESILRANLVDDVKIDSVDGFLIASAGKTLFRLPPGNVQPGAVELSGNRWRGTLLRFGTTNGPDVRRGELVSLFGLFGGKSTPARPTPFGVAMETNPNPRVDQNLVVGTEFVGAVQVAWDGTPLTDPNAELAVGSIPGRCRPVASRGSGFGYAFGTSGASQVWAVFR
jgi:hypothetical protein